ncbi:nucleoside hydrolase [Oceanobacillus jeddahense]|uniref:nucleoside hydrolase n=1 Tax=Oceanobacillus jeddahense TaxID=1462527 RepID=UPI000596197C|nr:nucleoside hydrolase [Oceanobacillus jeddahense]
MKRIILDVDTGIDDALSIVYAIKSKEIKLEGITTGFGNVSAEQATLNTLQVIEAAQPDEEIPVAMGAKKPLYRSKPSPVVHVHGSNGIGDYKFPYPKQEVEEENASDFIIRLLNENPHEITLVFVGRLTNLAIALKKDPTIIKKVKELVLMGGALKRPGNVTPWAEANIYGDPEAAKEVFGSGIPITMVGLDATTKADFREENLKELLEKMPEGNSKEKQLKHFLTHIIQFGFDSSIKMGEGKQRLLHDPLAIGVVINDNFVKTEEFQVCIETEGTYTVGATLTDLRRPQTEVNTKVCLDVNRKDFFKHFIDTLSNQHALMS